MLEEDAIPSADRHLCISEYVIGKTNAGRGIEEIPRHATVRRAIETATNDPVKDIAGARNKRA
jgi:hypothetical protein